MEEDKFTQCWEGIVQSLDGIVQYWDSIIQYWDRIIQRDDTTNSYAKQYKAKLMRQRTVVMRNKIKRMQVRAIKYVQKITIPTAHNHEIE